MARDRKTPRMSRLLRFKRDESGAMAIEFAFVAVPFLMLIGAILELGLVFMGSVSLDNAMTKASREIRTGQIKNAAGATSEAKEATRIQFQKKVCDSMGFAFKNCERNLTIDVRTATQFGDVNVKNPVQKGKFEPGALQFETGGASSIVIVTGYYRWTMIMPTMNQALVRLPGQTLLTSAVTFQNEPY